MNEEDIKKFANSIRDFDISLPEHLDEFKLRFLSRKGLFSVYFDRLKLASIEERAELGRLLNELKEQAKEKFLHFENLLSDKKTSTVEFDFTIPGSHSFNGTIHPVKKVLRDILVIFERLGFEVKLGPEIEKDDYNFLKLNFEPNHPARDMQDTLYVKRSEELEDDILLRTHTSSVQIRTMLASEPPIRFVAPGKVYRNESVSARSLCVFNQIEGAYIDKNVNFRDLKGVLFLFVRHFFGEDVKVRFRPSFFPFTEPSAEMDVSCYVCSGIGCRLCKKTGWLEILGCGMIHQNVLKNCSIDNRKFSGFAFGMGIERITMLRYQISDIRTLYENDSRFLSQFSLVK